ncbi:putative RNA-directed DNA polymerase from transposon X-element [Trichonephila clavipes]|nr:putative RNA-directed DNA polymerase from transposon X-element [Trichonephila clavipes]
MCGHTISPSKSSCVHFCRKRNQYPDSFIHIRNIQIPVVMYGSARTSVLKRLDTIHHSALRICSGVFRTSPVTSLYVVCHQPPLELRRRQSSAKYFIRAMSVPSHPLKPFALAIGLNRLYEARSFNIKPFSKRARAVLNDAHLININIQENNILAFPPWDIQIFNYHNPFSGYHKADTADVFYQQLFSFYRSKYSKYLPVYTDGSKAVGHVGCGVVFNNTILSFSLHNFMSVFSAELTAILIALQHILIYNHRHFCAYTDSMSALESLHFLTERRHPTVIEILILLRKLERKGFHIIFSWVPGHVCILGDEQADTAARSTSDHMQRPVCCQDLKIFTQNYIHRVWQETWDQQIFNKLHNIHLSTSHWAALLVRRHDVRLTRLRIGHTRFTHRHLLLGENAPECPSLAKVGPCATKPHIHFTSARASVLKRLDTVHHSALRICSGAFRTSPVTSLYVVCHQPSLELRRRQLSTNYFIRAMSVPSHPLKPFSLAIGLIRLYEARSFNIKTFSERAKAVLNDAHLNNINIQESNILAFPPWDVQVFNYHNPFSGYDKAGNAAIIYQQLFSYHRSKYSKNIPVYTDGLKTVGHVGCGVVFNNTILNFTLHNSMSVFSAELTAILVALQHIIVSIHRHFCVYTDSMSALEYLHFSTEHRHPTVIEIILLLRKLERRGFDIIFSWVPVHVCILGNEQADTTARSMSDHMQRPVCYRDLKTSTQNYIHSVWQETWDQQILNKLHNIHLSLLIGQHYQCEDTMSA